MKLTLKKLLSGALAFTMVVPALTQALAFLPISFAAENETEWTNWDTDENGILSVAELKEAILGADGYFENYDTNGDGTLKDGLVYNTSTMFNYDAALFNDEVHKAELNALLGALTSTNPMTALEGLGLSKWLKEGLQSAYDAGGVNAAIAYWQKNGRWSGFYFNDSLNSSMESEYWGGELLTEFPTAATYANTNVGGYYKVVIPDGDYLLSANADADDEKYLAVDEDADSILTEAVKANATVLTFERIPADAGRDFTDAVDDGTEDYAYFVKVDGRYLTCVKTVDENGVETLAYELLDAPEHTDLSSSVFELYSVNNAATNDGSAIVLKAGGEDGANWFLNNYGASDADNAWVPVGWGVSTYALQDPGNSFKLERVVTSIVEVEEDTPVAGNQVIIPEGSYRLFNERQKKYVTANYPVDGDGAEVTTQLALATVQGVEGRDEAEAFNFVHIGDGNYYIQNAEGRYMLLQQDKILFLDDIAGYDADALTYQIYRYERANTYVYAIKTSLGDVLNNLRNSGTYVGAWWEASDPANRLADGGSSFIFEKVSPDKVATTLVAEPDHGNAAGADQQILIADGWYKLDSKNGDWMSVVDGAIAADEADGSIFYFKRVPGTNFYNITNGDQYLTAQATGTAAAADTVKLETGVATDPKALFLLFRATDGSIVLKAGGDINGDNHQNWFVTLYNDGFSAYGTGMGVTPLNNEANHFTLSAVYAPTDESEAAADRIYGMSGLIALQSAKGGITSIDGNEWVYVNYQDGNADALVKSSPDDDDEDTDYKGAATVWKITEVRPGVYNLQDVLSGQYLNLGNASGAGTNAVLSATPAEFYIYSFKGTGVDARDNAILLKSVGNNQFLQNGPGGSFLAIGQAMVDQIDVVANAYYVFDVDLTEDQAKFFHVRTGGNQTYDRQNVYTGNNDFWGAIQAYPDHTGGNATNDATASGLLGAHVATGLAKDTLSNGALALKVPTAGVFTNTAVAGKDIYENVGIPFIPIVQPYGTNATYTTYVFDASMFSARFGENDDADVAEGGDGLNEEDIQSFTNLEVNKTLQGVYNAGALKSAWLPFNMDVLDKANANVTADDGTTYVTYDGETADYHFGMKMNINFSITDSGTVSGDYTGNGGTDANNPDITFNFEGDDDVWVFIDGRLVLDIGGIHDRIAASLNFRTGEWKIENLVGNGKPIGAFDYTTGTDTNVITGNFYDLIGVAGEDNDAKREAFANDGNTVHQMTIFYLERGESESNCRITYNMIQNDSLTVTKLAEETYYPNATGDDRFVDLTEEEMEYIENLEFAFKLNDVANNTIFDDYKLEKDEAAEGTPDEEITFDGWDINTQYGAGLNGVDDDDDADDINIDTSVIVPFTLMDYHNAGDIIEITEEYLTAHPTKNIVLERTIQKQGVDADGNPTTENIKQYLMAAHNGVFYLRSGETAAFKMGVDQGIERKFQVVEDATFGFGNTDYFYHAYVGMEDPSGDGWKGKAEITLTDADKTSELFDEEAVTAGVKSINLRIPTAVTFGLGDETGMYAVDERDIYQHSAMITDSTFTTDRASNVVSVLGTQESLDEVNIVAQNYWDCPEDVIVVDYDLSIEFDVDNDLTAWSDNTAYQWFIELDEITGAKFGKTEALRSNAYGDETYYNNVKYTLTEQLTNVEKLTYFATVNGDHVWNTMPSNAHLFDGVAPIRGVIYIVPATVMHYEENFNGMVNYVNDDTANYEAWKEVTTAGNDELQDLRVIGKYENRPYGSDTHYIGDKYDSNGTSMYVKTTEDKPAQFSYTFKGTGTSFFARTGANSGFIKIVVTDNNKPETDNVVFTYYRDSQYQDTNNSTVDDGQTNLYGIPLFTWEALEDSGDKISSTANDGYGSYTVTVTVAKEFEHTNANGTVVNVYGTEFWLDGIRVFNPLDPNDSATIYRTTGFEKVGEYAYKVDNEYDPHTITVRDKLLLDSESANQLNNWRSMLGVETTSITGVAPNGVFTDTVNDIDDYYEFWLKGPKEEVYLKEGQSITFYLPDLAAFNNLWDAKVYLGVKAPFGNASATINGQVGEFGAVANATECYYAISSSIRPSLENGQYEVTITATDGLIALTNIRIASNGADISDYSFVVGGTN